MVWYVEVFYAKYHIKSNTVIEQMADQDFDTDSDQDQAAEYFNLILKKVSDSLSDLISPIRQNKSNNPTSSEKPPSSSSPAYLSQSPHVH